MSKNYFPLIALLSLIIFSGISSAALLSDQGTNVKQNATGNLLQLGNLTIEVYDASSGGNLIYSLESGDAIVNGSWNIMINPTTEFGKSYWKDYKINGEDLDFDGNERIEFQAPIGQINNVSFINFSLISSCAEGSSIRLIYANGSVVCETDSTDNSSSDLTNYAMKNESAAFMGNITTNQTGFFGFLGSIAQRITTLFATNVNVSNNVDVAGNVSAQYFIGNGSGLTGIVATSTSNWDITNSNYLINSSGILSLNESKLNSTINVISGTYAGVATSNVSGINYTLNTFMGVATLNISNLQSGQSLITANLSAINSSIQGFSIAPVVQNLSNLNASLQTTKSDVSVLQTRISEATSNLTNLNASIQGLSTGPVVANLTNLNASLQTTKTDVANLQTADGVLTANLT